MKNKLIICVALLSLLSGCKPETLIQSNSDVTEQSASSSSSNTEEDLNLPIKDSVLPSQSQYSYQKKGLVAFFHFGPMTFLTHEQMQWGTSLKGKNPSEVFTLRKKIDADRYVKTLKDAGFGEIIFTVKHHDGFSLWNTKYTDFNATKAGYPGDVLEDLSAACTKYNMDLGIYLSPWDNYNEYYGTQPDKYNEYYNNQLEEILSNDKYGNNGRISDVWMDGANPTSGQFYSMDVWQNTIEKYEPGAIITLNDFTDASGKIVEIKNPAHWVKNENGIAWDESWSKINFDPTKGSDVNSNASFAKGYQNGNKWSVIETDVGFFKNDFFWREGNQTPFSNTELGLLYKYSVGRGANLLLGVSLNKEGTLPEQSYKIIEDFGSDLKSLQSNSIRPLDIIASSTFPSNKVSVENLLDGDASTFWTTNEQKNNNGKLTIRFDKKTQFDTVIMEESIEYGQRIKKFDIKYKDQNSGEFKTFYLGSTIGPKKISNAAPVTTDEIEINLESIPNTQPILAELKILKASDNFSYKGIVPSNSLFIDISKETTDEGDGFIFDKNVWATQGNIIYEQGTNMYLYNDAPGQEFQINFTGNNISLVGTLDPNHGAADVYLDEVKIGEFDQANTDTRKIGQVLFSKDGFENKKHNLKVVSKMNSKGKAMLGIEGAFIKQ